METLPYVLLLTLPSTRRWLLHGWYLIVYLVPGTCYDLMVLSDGQQADHFQFAGFASAADGIIIRTKSRQGKRLRRISQTTNYIDTRMLSRVEFSAARSAYSLLHDCDGFSTFFGP